MQMHPLQREEFPLPKVYHRELSEAGHLDRDEMTAEAPQLPERGVPRGLRSVFRRTTRLHMHPRSAV